MSADTNNQRVAELLREMAGLLEAQDANPFRINAYRRAAQTVSGWPEDVAEVHRSGGRDGLKTLPFVGEGIASAIEAILVTGRFPQLDRLRGELEPEQLFDSIPGVGPVLARAIHDTLHLDTLEELELAAHDGRLERVPGIGKARAESIRAVLAQKLRRSRIRPRRHAPAVRAILAADREYRQKAAEGVLKTIAPRRFNPQRRPWLPVMHTVLNGWHMTALYSNTALAHELGKTDDWVVVYYYDGDHNEGQCTVVTETHGPRKGARVVRGREDES